MRVPAILILSSSLVVAGCRTVSQGPTGREGAAPVIEGRVERVAPDDTSVTVLDQRAGEAVVLIAPDADVRIDDFKASFDDLQEGQRVRASLGEVDGVQQVIRIEILDRAVPTPEPDRAPEP